MPRNTEGQRDTFVVLFRRRNSIEWEAYPITALAEDLAGRYAANIAREDKEIVATIIRKVETPIT